MPLSDHHPRVHAALVVVGPLGLGLCRMASVLPPSCLFAGALGRPPRLAGGTHGARRGLPQDARPLQATSRRGAAPLPDAGASGAPARGQHSRALARHQLAPIGDLHRVLRLAPAVHRLRIPLGLLLLLREPRRADAAGEGGPALAAAPTAPHPVRGRSRMAGLPDAHDRLGGVAAPPHGRPGVANRGAGSHSWRCFCLPVALATAAATRLPASAAAHASIALAATPALHAPRALGAAVAPVASASAASAAHQRWHPMPRRVPWRGGGVRKLLRLGRCVLPGQCLIVAVGVRIWRARMRRRTLLHPCSPVASRDAAAPAASPAAATATRGRGLPP